MKKKRKLKINEEGFTLIEMLIVIALIGIITTWVGSNLIEKFGSAKVDSTKIQMKQLAGVLDQFKLDCNFYPLTNQGMDALIEKPSGRECKRYDPNGYIKGGKVPLDSWGTEFDYESDGRTFEIISFGADAQEGGEGNDADIRYSEIE